MIILVEGANDSSPICGFCGCSTNRSRKRCAAFNDGGVSRDPAGNREGRSLFQNHSPILAGIPPRAARVQFLSVAPTPDGAVGNQSIRGGNLNASR